MESNSSRSTIFAHSLGPLTPSHSLWPTSPAAAAHLQLPKAIISGPAAAMAKLESVYDDLEAVICGEVLMSASDADRRNALSDLQSIADLSDKQAFLLRARASVHVWLAHSCSHLMSSVVSHLSGLICSLQVESHSAQSISLPQCAMQQRGAVVSLHHGFQSGGCEVTSQLRVAAEFRHSSQRPGTTTERLSIGVDIEWQIQPLDVAAGPPAVGALSLPAFLVVSNGDPSETDQVPDLEQLSRLQGMFQCVEVPAFEFLGFLLALAMAPDLKAHPGVTSFPSKPCPGRTSSSMDCYQMPAGITGGNSDTVADSGSVHNGSRYQQTGRKSADISVTCQTARQTNGQTDEADRQTAAASAPAFTVKARRQP